MYNYYENVKSNVKDVLQDYYTREELENELRNGNREKLEEALDEKLWNDDSVTGNASGSYTFNTYEAKQNLFNNEDEIKLAAAEFGYPAEINLDGYERGFEWWDVAIRCYYLSQAIAEVLDELEEVLL